MNLEMARALVEALLGSTVRRRRRAGEAGYTMQMVVATALLVALTIAVVAVIAAKTMNTANGIKTQ